MDGEQSLTVGELTKDHYGQIVVVDSPKMPNGHEIYLFQHRAWNYRGKDMVGLVDKKSAWRDYPRNVIGTEYAYTSNTPCRLAGQWQRPRGRK